MKKILIIGALFLSVPFAAFATSGACSSHLGVNCSAGASYAGSVQCNDGWTNSSVLFSDTDECKVAGCNLESLQFSLGSSGQVGSGTGEALVNNCQNINTAITNANLPQTSNTSSLDDAMQRFCVETFGPSSFSDLANKTCGCNAGYVHNKLSNNRCEPKYEVYDNICKTSYGPKSVASSTDSLVCSCVAGYEQDPKTNFMCKPQIEVRDAGCKRQYGPNSSISTTDINTCLCDSGFTLGPDKQCSLVIESPQVGKDTLASTIYETQTALNLSKTPIKTEPKIQKTEVKKKIIADTKEAAVVSSDVSSSTEDSWNETLRILNQPKPEQKHWYYWLNPLNWFK